MLTQALNMISILLSKKMSFFAKTKTNFQKTLKRQKSKIETKIFLTTLGATVHFKTQFQPRLVFVQAVVVASSFLSHAANNYFFFRDEFFGFSSFLISILP